MKNGGTAPCIFNRGSRLCGQNHVTAALLVGNYEDTKSMKIEKVRRYKKYEDTKSMKKQKV